MKQFLKNLIILLLTVSAISLYAQNPASATSSAEKATAVEKKATAGKQGQPPPLAGQPLIDSLLKELPKQKEDTNKVNILNGLSSAYRLSNPDEGIKYGQQELELATKLEWKKGMAGANECLGSNYQNKADYPKALAYYNEALKMGEELDNKKEIAAVLGNIGIVYACQGDYPKALEYFFKDLKMAEETGNKNDVAGVTANIGLVYVNQGDFPKALEYYFKALKMAEETGNKSGVAIVTGNIGAVYKVQCDFPKALEYLFKSLKMDEEIGNKNGVGINTGNIGEVYSLQHNYTQAVAWEFKALQIFEETGDKNNEAISIASIGGDYIGIVTYEGNQADGAKMATVAELGPMPYWADTLIPKGKPALLHKAVMFLNKAIAMDKEIGSLDYLQQAYHSLSTADSLLGDYQGAYYAHIQYTIIKDSVFSTENNKKITKLGMQNEYDKKTAVAQKAAALKLQKQQVLTYAGLAGVLALLLFSMFIVRNNKLLGKEKKRSEDLLLNILPGEVANELKDTGTSAARHFDNVTVLFTDFVNFTQAGERMSPQALIDELHTCFKAFDDITTKYSVEKIKTIGDAYLAVAGLPTTDLLHAEHIVRAAIEINAFMQDRIAKLGNRTFEIRIGIHTGSVVAGIVGVKKFAYDIWGDTVNTAARMEQNSQPGKINISQTTFELVKDKFTCAYRGEIDAKGKGQLKMYYVS